MINAIRNFFTPPVFEEDEDKSRTAGVLFRILIATYILLPTAILVLIINPGVGGFYSPIALMAVVLVTVLLFIAKRGYIRAASMSLIASFLILSTIVDISANGEVRPISILSGAVIVAGGLLLGPRGSLITAILYGIKHILVLFLIHNKLVVIANPSIAPTPAIDGITTFIAYFMIAIVFGLASNSIYSALTQVRQSEAKLTVSNQQLQELTQNLEQRIQQRTTDLEEASALSEKRARQFEAITRISSTITSVQNLQELLPRISEVISRQFGFYHVGIFLTDASRQYAVLSAANSDGGRKMLKRSHQLKIGEQGIVGYVTGTGKPRVALDVGEDIVFFNNPDLPETHSEMALPLQIAGNIIGALDVQSIEPNAFSVEDVNILSVLADQVSLAIQNARLFDQSAKLLSESEAIQHQYLRDTWSRLPQEENFAGFRYSAVGSTQIELGEKVQPIDNSAYNEIVTPIKIRNETIGTLSIHIPQHERVTTDQMDLIKAVAERVALSAENARLFEETSRRASRESLVSDITTKIRSTNSPQEMIKTAVEELQRALGATRVEIIPRKNVPSPDK
ncbi:MAG: GAF domain-containing protein [Anaerolineales bacterium]|uniref:GAF domain-containing protein n=1 Tax=Candidatus Villigracilis proximus TaxID=3140683 RepID=UPI0031355934|nr:GAF domain-containing protein [Anaerolineales bacterium]MBK9209273.1 GAF domain-containing protein [Anaerolineales bacterium]